MKYGQNFGFLVMDELAQQNTDLSSTKNLLQELLSLSKYQQIFMFYKLESEETNIELFKELR